MLSRPLLVLASLQNPTGTTNPYSDGTTHDRATPQGQGGAADGAVPAAPVVVPAHMVHTLLGPTRCRADAPVGKVDELAYVAATCAGAASFGTDYDATTGVLTGATDCGVPGGATDVWVEVGSWIKITTTLGGAINQNGAAKTCGCKVASIVGNDPTCDIATSDCATFSSLADGALTIRSVAPMTWGRGATHATQAERCGGVGGAGASDGHLDTYRGGGGGRFLGQWTPTVRGLYLLAVTLGGSHVAGRCVHTRFLFLVPVGRVVAAAAAAAAPACSCRQMRGARRRSACSCLTPSVRPLPQQPRQPCTR